MDNKMIIYRKRFVPLPRRKVNSKIIMMKKGLVLMMGS